MTPSQVTQLLIHALPARLPLLLVGPPGVGKSSLVEQATATINYDMILSHPGLGDPTDVKGFPWPDKETGTARFLPFGELARALQATRPTVWFLDDLGQAPPAVQASYMQLLLARRVNEHVLPDCVSFVAATNRRQDRAGVQGILEPVKGRFACILNIEPSIQDWSEWAMSCGFIPAEMIAFLRFRTDLLCQPKPTTEMENSPNPRTWANLARLQALSLPDELRLSAFTGAVGEGAAVEYSAFLKMFKSLTSIDTILIDPNLPDLPSKPDELFAVATALATRANPQTYARIGSYCERLHKAGLAEYAVLCLRDSLRREPTLMNTPEHTKICSSPLGRMFLGV